MFLNIHIARLFLGFRAADRQAIPFPVDGCLRKRNVAVTDIRFKGTKTAGKVRWGFYTCGRSGCLKSHDFVHGPSGCPGLTPATKNRRAERKETCNES